ncbi:MAG: hypothetical protein P1U88_09640 [Thalassobaculaceae bacterium]|nr:hypothetical protein [Thalassobaculaceae bacterium]
MNRTVVVLSFAVLLSAAILWAGGIALVSYRHWHDTHTRIAAKRDVAKDDCAARYYDLDAKLRCEHLHDVKFLTEINIAKATRGTVAAGPLVLLLLAGWLMLRSDRKRKAARIAGSRPLSRRRDNRSPA